MSKLQLSEPFISDKALLVLNRKKSNHVLIVVLLQGVIFQHWSQAISAAAVGATYGFIVKLFANGLQKNRLLRRESAHFRDFADMHQWCTYNIRSDKHFLSWVLSLAPSSRAMHACRCPSTAARVAAKSAASHGNALLLTECVALCI